MAASFGTNASAASSVASNAPKYSTYLPLRQRHFHDSHSKVFFRLTTKPKLRLSFKSSLNHSVVARAQLDEGAADGSSNTAATSSAKSEVSPAEAKDVNEPAPSALASQESLSAFMAQVADLVKLVDSKDIMELQLKQLDCELLIRKKEALPPPPSPPSHFPPPIAPTSAPALQAPSPAPAPAPAAVPSPAPKSEASPAAKSPKSSLPPLKCPMAGTFYRSPGPGEPPFVKVGDSVQKGQVLCIIEAMKLMNEIEADQSGKVVEILAEDGKPVSIDIPLFIIEP